MVGRGEITDVAWEQIEPLLGLDIRVLQSSARHGNTPRLTRKEIRSAVRVRSSALRFSLDLQGEFGDERRSRRAAGLTYRNPPTRHL